MKRLLSSLIIILSLNSFFGVNAQNFVKNIKKRHAFYGHSQINLKNTDTISGFNSKEEKLKITGTIYESDGITPAKGVILYICQADEYGDYNPKKVNGQRVLEHQGWVKTDTDGKYTFYTFVPGTYWPSRKIQQIHAIVKAPNDTEAYQLNHFVFDNDPLLRASCKRKIETRGLNNVLKLEKKDSLLIGKRDIILNPISLTY
ncbi:hypothetical protein [Hyunsoonleella pacifica]|uniref:Uncharacterized protein n=1 Tax=Hyunsoonleella pacifica TaxID=1080224 RepID=A0A4Q9FR96_9FLAO|nr:hypothetical protein [Hyunsoonleella pacifica]TBN17773.1 hypothetical protein EYD46_05525 [Hyunsoonleella pacifica]GGD09091.1 hypothetical protein GCM10011368_08780 [Hyunsoonleella pacifica]